MNITGTYPCNQCDDQATRSDSLQADIHSENFLLTEVSKFVKNI